MGKPANPRSKVSRPARPDGRTGNFKFRASPKPASAPVEIAAAPAPVIPAELLVDPPKPAKPRKARGKKEEAEPARPASALDMILAQLDDAKAEQVVTIALDDKSAIADTMVVATGRSNRHVGAIADHLVEKLKAAGRRDLKIEGMPQCDWVLVDAGDVVVHIFRPEVRSFYNLEKLWSDHAPNERLVT
ncbi:ribosome silencing factor [Aestuariivirga sp.]|uniref:ribosome silencing factor n=1 Tax=Aestuariivirga sp. TaxID=2650926 RepID=UPI0035937B3E